MRRFRPLTLNAVPGLVTDLFAVGQLIDDAMQPGHFFVAPELRLTWIAGRSETIPWEIFRARLVEASQTRLQKTFLSWHVVEENETHPATEPTISVKLDVHERHIHVTRGLLAYVWKGYDSGGGVIESREAVSWTRELVGTMRLEDFADLENARDELICLIWQAIVGTSRLPLTSVEAPLPAFSFGQLHYLFQMKPGEQACVSWEDWLRRGLQTERAWRGKIGVEDWLQLGLQADCAWRETVKLVEFTLRHIQGTREEIHRLIQAFGDGSPMLPRALARLMRTLFNDVSLSPLTQFAYNSLALGVIWGGTDFLSHLLRQLCRHLTAYDLITFHHRGANYPDALVLDAAVKHFAMVVAADFSQDTDHDRRPSLRRRALRQACLLRRSYEGHFVPDAPTSPGENARVLPASHPRVPEEQMTQTKRRQRQLFVDEPLADLLSPDAISVLAHSVADLEHLEERVEMGLGLFIDRPLGYAKQLGEPDLTPILAHEAFSPSLARRRWGELKKLCTELAIDVDANKLDAHFANSVWLAGLPHSELAECPRPVAALGDVRKVADDFVILRTRPVGLAQMLGHFNFVRTLRERYRIDFGNQSQTPRLCVQARGAARLSVLALYDEQLRRRVELGVDVAQGFITRAGVELPRAGLRVVAVWEDTNDPAVLQRREICGTLISANLH
jgi:hypothetical protein